MARGKVQMKRIENPVHRQVTFCKRRAGLLKKAKELSVLCDAEIGLFIFSAHGKLYELATKGTMQGLIERYMNHTSRTQPPDPSIENQTLEIKEEVNRLKQEIEVQKGLRNAFGGGAEGMTLDELDMFEKQLEIWICQVRSTKMKFMCQEIEALKNQMEENIGYTTNIEAVNNNTNFQYPLTIQDELFQLCT
ncbi:agamous-like MADS-box protein AGL12 isoform X2 [Momordica charantia]|uniref:Agamous-like MADS-box protein AGL12 isoform X2 n=1 Tax=Momordica charantia TaxID=3673 RepID=A0A6J1D898_MOMCH|nr:agamous-like MADS-box protein AGL12 isoform X2 [Momordica charantia]